MTDILTDDMRAKMAAINANLSHVKRRPSGTRVFRYDKQKDAVVEDSSPNVAVKVSMFPYYSPAMAVDPSEIPLAKEMLKANGIFAEFNEDGEPRIDSALQHRKMAKAMGLFDGKHGFGSVDEEGNHQQSGRPEAERQARGQDRTRRLRKKLEEMPESVDIGQFDTAMEEFI